MNIQNEDLAAAGCIQSRVSSLMGKCVLQAEFSWTWFAFIGKLSTDQLELL